jgi:hypothetical protein
LSSAADFVILILLRYVPHRFTSSEEMKPTSFILCALPTIPIVAHLGIQVFGTLRLRAANGRIHGAIRCRADLDQVRSAIQTNLFLGIPIICNTVLLAASLFLAARVSGFLMLFWITVLAAGQAVLWKTCRPIEKRFKSLPVESRDADDLASEYRGYVEQWAGPHLFLKSAKDGDRK